MELSNRRTINIRINKVMFEQLFYHNDKAFKVKRKISKINFEKPGENPNLNLVKAWSEWLECDHVLQTETHYLFCETIKEANQYDS